MCHAICVYIIVVLGLKLARFPLCFPTDIDDDADVSLAEHYDVVLILLLGVRHEVMISYAIHSDKPCFWELFEA